LTITHATVTSEPVWAAFRHPADVRLRERYHAILLLRAGASCSEVAQGLYRYEETRRAWVHALHGAGLSGLERATIPERPT